MNVAMWGRAMSVIPRVSKQEWDTLDVVAKWLIATRFAVAVMTFISASIAGLLAYRDGAFDGDDDIAYGDFLVRAYRAGTDVVLAETISDEQGLYGFDALGAGVVDVRYFTRSIGRDRTIQQQLYHVDTPAHAYELLHADEESEDFNYFLED